MYVIHCIEIVQIAGGFELRIEPVKVRRRRLAEAIYMNRRNKNVTKIKVDSSTKAEPVDENDSSLPNKENNISSLVESYSIVKVNQKSEKLVNVGTVENVSDNISKDKPEAEVLENSCSSQSSNVIVEKICDTEEMNMVKVVPRGIYDEHNYVILESTNVNSIAASDSHEDDRNYKENKMKQRVSYDLQKQKKRERIKKENTPEKATTQDLGKFMVAETLLNMVRYNYYYFYYVIQIISTFCSAIHSLL